MEKFSATDMERSQNLVDPEVGKLVDRLLDEITVSQQDCDVPEKIVLDKISELEGTAKESMISPESAAMELAENEGEGASVSGHSIAIEPQVDLVEEPFAEEKRALSHWDYDWGPPSSHWDAEWASPNQNSQGTEGNREADVRSSSPNASGNQVNDAETNGEKRVVRTKDNTDKEKERKRKLKALRQRMMIVKDEKAVRLEALKRKLLIPRLQEKSQEK